MHLIGQGVAKHLYELITVSLGKKNSCSGLVNPDVQYTFDIPKATLQSLGYLVGDSLDTVPSSFTGKWVDPITGYKGGNRAVDWIDFMFHMLPTVFVPHLPNQKVKDAVNDLVLACRLALQWEITENDLNIIKR